MQALLVKPRIIVPKTKQIALFIQSDLKMKRPNIVINCAMSADGKIASPTGKQIRISSEEDIKRMYKLRNECDAVLVGVNTVLSDDPKLTLKDKYVKNPNQPLRIVLDSKCRTPENALVVNEKAKTLIVTTKKCDKNFKANVEILVCPEDETGFIDLNYLLENLEKRGIKKLMVEGGGTIIWSFLNKGLVDDFFLYLGPLVIGGKQTPTLARGDSEKPIPLEIVKIKELGEGVLFHYRLIK